VDPGSAGDALRPGRLIFKHAVTQQVAYESLLARRRAELHRRAGEAVEVLWPERLDEEAATLGYHFERGGVPARAAAYHARAADRARAAYANVEAIGHYSAALAQLEELDRRAPAGAGSEGARTGPAGPLPSAAVLSENLGDVLLLTGRQEEAREAHARALELVPEGDAFAPARLLRKQAHDCEVLRDIPRALGLYEEAERSLPESGDAAGTWWREWLEIRLARAWAHYFTADWRRIAEEVEAVRPVVERDGSARQRNLFFQRLVLMAFRRERYVVAAATLADAETALSWARQTGDPVQIADADFVCGLARLCRRDLDAAELHLRAALDWADRIGDNLVHCRCLTYLSLCSRLRGDVEATRTWTRRAMESAREGGRIEYIATGEANEAWLAWRAGDPVTACARGLEALELWGRSWAEYPFQWSAVWPLVAAEFGEGRLKEALEHAKLLLGSSQQPLVGGVGRRINLALTAAGRGEPDLAVEELGAALRAAPEVGYL
jgi:tetratricopeptide (TPR) repeat protein